MNKLDKAYTDLLQDILDNGITKSDRTGTGTLSVFGRQIRHNMADGFPLLTTKKMYFKGVVTELLWFLRGDTNIKYLVDNDCHIWDGDAYKNYTQTKIVKNNDSTEIHISPPGHYDLGMTKEKFIERIKTDDYFAKKWGDLGPIYGKQWRQWQGWLDIDGKKSSLWFDQIQRILHTLKTNPDDRGMVVSAWNVAELDQMVLRPCHYGFQVYTRELSQDERQKILETKYPLYWMEQQLGGEDVLTRNKIPTRAISLMWQQRSVDTFLGLPFNIASYGLLLEMIAKEVNMVPDELIGNLGDTHLYSNHIEQAKEQITRTSFDLPKLKLNFDYTYFDGYIVEWNKIDPSKISIENYQSHPPIKAPLSN